MLLALLPAKYKKEAEHKEDKGISFRGKKIGRFSLLLAATSCPASCHVSTACLTWEKAIGGFYQTLSLPSKLEVGVVIISDSDLLFNFRRLCLGSSPTRFAVFSFTREWEGAVGGGYCGQ